MKSYITLLIFLCMEIIGFAQDVKIPQKVDDLAVRYAEATAFFEIVAEALAKSGSENSKAEAMRDDAMLYSLLLANEGRSREFAVKVTHARIEFSKKEMLKEMDYRNENIAIITNKYEESSLDLIKNPTKEVSDLLAKTARDQKNASHGDSIKK